jgi:hypothetical protein
MTRPLILIAAAIALVTALLIVTGAVGSASSSMPGDVDCTSTITMNDAAQTLAHAAHVGATPPCAHNGDTNCDGHYTADDALRIAAYVAGSPMPEPDGCPQIGPSAGPTPSPGESPPPAPTNSPTPTATPAATGQHTPTPTATRTPTPTPGHASTPTPPPTFLTGVEPACDVFPADNPWNTDISQAPVDARSADYLATIGTGGFLHPDFGTVWDGAPIGIPYVVVGADQPKVPVSFGYASESDPGPYPIPPNVPVEGQPVGQPNTANFGGDRHVLIVDDSACKLYEMFDAHPVNGGQSWTAGSGAVFDLNSNALRPETWTSADAAGLPIFAGLVRYSEVQSGVIDHALRFTVSDTQMAYLHPGTHWASDITDPDYPPMGLRFRMKASYDCSWADPQVQVICAAMKKYGMIVADNGSDWYVSGAPDSRWDDGRIGNLKDVPASAFEVVDTGETIHKGY